MLFTCRHLAKRLVCIDNLCSVLPLPFPLLFSPGGFEDEETDGKGIELLDEGQPPK